MAPAAASGTARATAPMAAITRSGRRVARRATGAACGGVGRVALSVWVAMLWIPAWERRSQTENLLPPAHSLMQGSCQLGRRGDCFPPFQNPADVDRRADPSPAEDER